MTAVATETLLINGKQAAKMIGVAESTMRKLREDGLPFVQLKRRPLYRPEDVRRWLASRATATTPEQT